jgi:hypothetical protein
LLRTNLQNSAVLLSHVAHYSSLANGKSHGFWT